MKKLSSSAIYEIGSWLFDSMSECRLCPMECCANRLENETGNCNSTDTVKVASCNLHFGEEPPLSGGGGSGTIFFSNCSLCCQYCQNYPISQMGTGSEASLDELTDIMLRLQHRSAENINFVTPDHMLPMILMALSTAKNKGLELPIVYNCSGYQKFEILKQLDGIIDIYLADMRYDDNNTAKRLSGCENYVINNQKSIKEMYRQVGNLKMNENGLAESGLIIRHLVLPNRLSGSEGIFKFLAEEVSKEVYVSLMSQYFPAHKAAKSEDLRRRITGDEFQSAVDAFYAVGLKNGFIQHMDYEKSY